MIFLPINAYDMELSTLDHSFYLGHVYCYYKVICLTYLVFYVTNHSMLDLHVYDSVYLQNVISKY